MVDRLGWTLIHFVWEGAAVALLLALALLAARRASAALRYALALGALVLMIACPIVTYALLTPTITIVVTGDSAYWAGETIVGGSAAIEKLPILVNLWAIGVGVLSLRLVGSLLQLERWRRRWSRPATDEEQSHLNGLARRIGIRRRITLFLTERSEVPSAWGVLRPVIVLPLSMATYLSPAQVEGILLHELAHIRRHDYLVNLLQNVVETALFYHPAVWWVSAVVRREREHLCDDVAVAQMGDPVLYARALLFLEERRQIPRPALSAKGGHLMNRIARILNPQPAPKRISPLAPTIAALSIVGLALGGALRANAQTHRDTKPKAGQTAVATPRPAPVRARVIVKRAPSAKTVSTKDREIKVLQANLMAMRAQLEATQAQLFHIQQNRMQAAIAAPYTRAISGAKTAIASTPRTAAEATRPVAMSPSLQSAEVAKTAPVPASLGGGFGGGVGGGGFGVHNEPTIEDAGSGRVTIDAESAPFSSLIRNLAKTAKISVVVQPGDYNNVTVVLQNYDASEALKVLCEAANATIKGQGQGVYYIGPRDGKR